MQRHGDDGGAQGGRDRANTIAKCCLDLYQSLPARGAKPAIRSDGKWEWTILAGVVLGITLEDGEVCYMPISIATGVKALPYDDLSIYGDVLHDCHAEVLARRIARAWLLQRLVHEVLQTRGRSDMLKTTTNFDKRIPSLFHQEETKYQQPRWQLREDVVSLHLYCSTLPCGDASNAMVLQRRQALDGDNKDDGPVRSTGTAANSIASTGPIRGRSTLSMTETSLRTKPGRPDSLPSISMSCTDKICMWALCGLQGSSLSRWLEPVRFASIIVSDEALRSVKLSSSASPSADESWTQEDRDEASARCTAILSAKIDPSRAPIPQIVFSSVPFPHSRESVEVAVTGANPNANIRGAASDDLDLVPAPGSIAYMAGATRHENLVEGRKQGASTKRRPGEALRPSTRSAFCKLEWFNACSGAVDDLERGSGGEREGSATYHASKHDTSSVGVEVYRRTKEQLRGYGHGDARAKHIVDDFLAQHRPISTQQGLNSGGAPERRSSSGERDLGVSKETDNVSPFHGWLVSGSAFELFDRHGRSRVIKD